MLPGDRLRRHLRRAGARRRPAALPRAIDVVQRSEAARRGFHAVDLASPATCSRLDLPDWGTGLAAARLSATDVLFLGAFAAYARRLGLRERAAEFGMLLGLLVAVASEVLLDMQLPTIALMAAGYLAQRRPPGALFARRADE